VAKLSLTRLSQKFAATGVYYGSATRNALNQITFVSCMEDLPIEFTVNSWFELMGQFQQAWIAAIFYQNN